MDQNTYTVDLCELAQIGDAWNVKVTSKWLGKRAEQGLLPGESHSPGIGRAGGREVSQYSDAVRRQLPLLLGSIQSHGKNLNAVGWALWKRGGNVHPRYWREQLEARVKNIERFRNYIRPENNSAKLSRYLTAKRLDPFLGRIRRKLRNKFSEFTDRILSLVEGTYEPLSALPHDEYEANIDYQRIASALSIPAHSPTTNIDARAFEEELSAIQIFLRMNLSEWFAAISDTEIVRARDELFSFTDALIIFGSFAPKWAKSALAIWIFEIIAQSVRAESALLMGWLWLRNRDGTREKMVELTQQLQATVQKLEKQKQFSPISAKSANVVI
jgi:hypothetical protein